MFFFVLKIAIKGLIGAIFSHRSGLNVVSRLSNFVDLWINKNIKIFDNQPFSENEQALKKALDLQRWIFKLFNITMSQEPGVKIAALNSLVNILNCCLNCATHHNFINDILGDERMLECLLFLLMPNMEFFHQSPKLRCMSF